MAEQKTSSDDLAPYPGSKAMPRWSLGKLIEAPRFEWGKLFTYLGPGLLMGGAAIGGGEWLTGPTITAKFGGGLLWLATLSILGQVVYNLEISRYTLYTGEPIFTGKFRTPPGPRFWLGIYLLLDIGAIFPYLAASAATPCAALYLQRIPNPSLYPTDQVLLQNLSYFIFLVCFIPLIFGGKIYNALKTIMSIKIIVVMGFLLVLAFGYSNPSTWVEIGNVPIKRAEDLNHNHILDAGEDWDKDGHLDQVEPEINREPIIDSDGDGINDAWPDFTGDGKPEHFVKVPRIDAKGNKTNFWWPDLDHDGKPDSSITVDADCDGVAEKVIPIDFEAEKPVKFIDFDGDKTCDGDNLENVFQSLARDGKLPIIDLAMIGFLSALVGISGQGGLSNTPISNYTRDQGWGMGHHVGAIPSVVGGHNLQLSHEGTVFIVNEESLPRWKRWYRHIVRDQLTLWAPACFFGIGLPSMLSVLFLKRGYQTENEYQTACMTADGVYQHAGGQLGLIFWAMTLVCGALVLVPTMASTIDGVVRRWVDVFWTSSAILRRMESQAIRYVYFGVLTIYGIFGVLMLGLARPTALLLIATSIYNFALGFSCWHTLWLNHMLLPKPLRPGWFMKISLLCSGIFFWTVGTCAVLAELKKLGFL
ncbi:MAG: Nramp family divalent metal transporter [Planctomycetota bacterium]